MANLIKKGNGFPTPLTPNTKPDKTETYAGKNTARVTKIYKQKDGTEVKVTKKINKDFSVTEKVERRTK